MVHVLIFKSKKKYAQHKVKSYTSTGTGIAVLTNFHGEINAVKKVAGDYLNIK
jgi:hypothetical protein